VSAIAAEQDKAEARHAVKDPVCGMSVEPASAAHRREHGGETYWFCSGYCARKFEAAPADYLQAERPKAKEVPADATPEMAFRR
jgi:P-type Cu+ transporter